MRLGLLLIACVATVPGCERARDVKGGERTPATKSNIAQRDQQAAAGDPNTTSAELTRDLAPAECATERADEGSEFELENQVGCTDSLTSPNDLYRGLTLGSEDEKAGAAFAVLRNRRAHSRTVISRAIVVATEAPSCSHLRPLTETLRDCSMDVGTRAGAALALGTIAQRHPCLFPSGHCAARQDPLPQWAQNILRRCATRYPTAVARACTEALGYLTLAQVPLLSSLRDNPKNDPALRVFAGRALTRLTRTPQVTDTSLDGLMSAAKGVAQ